MAEGAKDFEGKVAVVTGAAMGIGLACARRFAQGGAKVLLADVNVGEGMKAAEGIGSDAVFVSADVSSTEDVDRMAKAATEKWGGIDVLVNNAARAIGGKVHETDEATWQEVINTNLTSVWRGIRACVPSMADRGGGAIVNMSSAQALVGFSGWAAYAAAKGAINSLTQQAAIDLAPLGIRINAVAPGTILTPLNEKVFEEVGEETVKKWSEAHPIGRFGKPEEVAETVAFLTGDGSSFMTGEIVRVDGGLVIRGE